MKDRPIGLLITTVILLLISSILFPIWDFGHYFWSTPNARYWEWLSFGHKIAGPFMSCVMFLFIIIFFLMLISLIFRRIGRSKAPYIIGIIGMTIILSLSLLGMIAVPIVGAIEEMEWWWDGACFVGNIAPILILPLLIISLVLVSKTKKKKKEEISRKNNRQR